MFYILLKDLSKFAFTKKYSQLVLVSLVFLISACSNRNSGQTLAPIVHISSGNVQGVIRSYKSAASSDSATINSYKVYEYRGIPYALPPTGNRRWSLPEPVTSLGSGVFKAYDFGSACPQNPRSGSPEKYVDEDCLSLNVTTPSDMRPGEKLPVFFWIHGGAFVGGSSNLYRLDKLAYEGRLVVVSINYRLGAFGFMPHPAFASNGYNGNYGLEDQRLAMKWVQDNIASFGGDKTNVTIAGESAGAGSVCMHLASPEQVAPQSQIKVKDLFHKAIVQSAGCMQKAPTVAEGETKVSASIQANLCPSAIHRTKSEVLACMRRQSVEDILNQQHIYTAANSTDVTSISPVIGGNTIPLSFKDASAQNRLVNVPIMMGGTKSELVLYAGYFWQDSQRSQNPGPAINLSTIDSWLETFYNPLPVGGISSVKARYPNLTSSDSNKVAEAFGQVLSDYNPRLGINNCIYLHSADTIMRTSSRTYPIYQFEFADQNALVCGVGISEPCPPFSMGPVHSSELNYFFPNLSFTSKINAPNLSPTSQALANKMLGYWSNFAHTGTPNKTGLPQWPEYAGKKQRYGGASVMLLEPNNIKAYSSDTEHSCSAFWGTQYPNELN
jgi:para-nitrobenzyl esterase